ncbi:MAG: hypothetical protein KDB10_12760 [Acidimicrobiales bacterium]|nr:hypothetical protein [Acidimicrobiales bacterium]
MGEGHRWAELCGPARLLLLGAVAVVTAPAVVGAVTLLDNGWVPFGDEAALGVRSLDVLTSRSPLLGMPASALVGDELPHHPGPLLFWFDAPFVRVLGLRVGLVVAVATMNVVAAAAIVRLTFRRKGVGTAVGAAVAVTAFVASMFGATGIVRPLNAVAVLLPLLLVLFVAWWVAEGERRLVPLLVVVGSLVVQAYLPLAPTVLAAVAVAAVGASRAEPRPRWRAGATRPGPTTAPGHLDPLWSAQIAFTLVLVVALVIAHDRAEVALAALAVVTATVVAASAPGHRARLREALRPLVASPTRRATLAALALCWTVPALEALVNGGGNVRDLTAQLSASVPVEGTGYATDTAATLLGVPPLVAGHLPTAGFEESLSLVTVLVGLAWAALLVAAVRRGDRDTVALLAVAGAVVAAGAVAASRTPVGDGWIPVRWNRMLVVNAFFWFALLRSAARAVVRSARVGAPPRWSYAATAVALALALLVWDPPLLLRDENYEPWIRDEVDPIATALVDGPLTGDGRALVTMAGGTAYWELANAVAAELEVRGQPTATEVLEHYYGPARDGRRVDVGAVVHVLPAAASHPPEGAHLVSRRLPPGWDEAEARTLAADVAALVEREGGLELSAAGARQLPQYLYGSVDGACDPARADPGPCVGAEAYVADPDRLLALDPLVVPLLYRDAMVAAPALPAPLDASLRSLLAQVPVDVYVGPATAAGERPRPPA